MWSCCTLNGSYWSIFWKLGESLKTKTQESNTCWCSRKTVLVFHRIQKANERMTHQNEHLHEKKLNEFFVQVQSICYIYLMSLKQISFDMVHKIYKMKFNFWHLVYWGSPSTTGWTKKGTQNIGEHSNFQMSTKNSQLSTFNNFSCEKTTIHQNELTGKYV